MILLESMCQVGVVALGIYLLAKEESPEEVRKWTTFFADAQVEFSKPVFPGEKVEILGEKIFWRRKKLSCRVEMRNASGQLVAQGTASGVGVKL